MTLKMEVRAQSSASTPYATRKMTRSRRQSESEERKSDLAKFSMSPCTQSVQVRPNAGNIQYDACVPLEVIFVEVHV